MREYIKHSDRPNFISRDIKIKRTLYFRTVDQNINKLK